MKKAILFLILIAMVLLCSACGNTETSQGSNPPETSTSAPATSSNNNSDVEVEKDIELSDLLNHPVSPDSDFFCDDDGTGGLVILEYLGNEEIVVVPDSINGKPIKSITKYVFANNCSVKAIKLPDSLEKISGYVFTQNKNLQIVHIGSGLKEIGESAFQACESLKEINLPNGLKTIKKLAFSQCRALKNVEIPSSVESIEIIAFNLMSEDFTISGEAGSVAEQYANSESITFIVK